jgi:RHH-type transcriptional regulator, proline utilization regulon repressor / proline dehydrogenase / delta 1-pyrroline-5-carboxylate dehydrogenase
MNVHHDQEERIRDIGLSMCSAIGEKVPSLFDGQGWKAEVLERAMCDESFRVRLFRFIDVLPSLRSDIQLIRLYREYFSDVYDAPVTMKRHLTEVLAENSTGLNAAKEIRTGVESLAGQFIAGRDAKDGLHCLKELRRQNYAASLDILGEEVLSEKEARAYSERYQQLVAFVSPQLDEEPEASLLDQDDKGPIPRLDVSLKVSSFYSQIDPVNWEGSIESAARGLKPIIETAERLNASVTIDMEQYYVKGLTLEILKRVLEEHPNFSFGGIVIQAYLKDTESDVLDLIEWAKRNRRRVTVRLVKGAYWDYETVINRRNGWPVPVFQKKAQTDFNYEKLTRMLLENPDYLRPAFATHNVRSIAHAVAVAESLKLPKNAIEFQVIYGMAEPIREVLRDMGFRVRVYTPVGALIPGMGYLIRRLLENTFHESFLRKAFVEGNPSEELLQAQRPKGKPGGEEHRGEFFRNEPPTDFSKAENRARMKQALESVKRNFNREYPLLIGGQEVRTANYADSLNPSRPVEIVGRVAIATSSDADKAVEQARKSWHDWRNRPPEQRARILLAAAEEMRKQRFELMALEVYEVGKTWKDADGDVAEAIDYLEYYALEAMRLGYPGLLGNYPGETNYYLCEPRGVGLVISPWNFPLAIATGMVSAGIVTGNCVIFKPSGLSAVCGWKLVEIFRLAGLPPGVLQFIPGPGAEVGQHLVSHPGIDFVAFTGSKDVGLRILKIAGDTQPGQPGIKRVIAELGGKNAIIVDETADLDDAVKGVLESALGFQGQKCSACSRVIVLEPEFDEFNRRLKDAMESVEIGPADDPRSYMGPVVDQEALIKIRAYVRLGGEEGTPALVRAAEGEGYFVGPVIIVDASPESRIATEEVFGPVLTVFRAQDIDEAIEIANKTAYALTGGLFSRSPANIGKVSAEFRVGNLYINRKITGALVGRQPFGGFGMSGVGSKAGGPDYLVQFTNMRSISENTLRRGFSPKTRPSSV